MRIEIEEHDVDEKYDLIEEFSVSVKLRKVKRYAQGGHTLVDFDKLRRKEVYYVTIF